MFDPKIDASFRWHDGIYAWEYFYSHPCDFSLSSLRFFAVIPAKAGIYGNMDAPRSATRLGWHNGLNR